MAHGTVQTCFIHLIRRTFQYASSKYWDELSKDLKPIYQAAHAEAAAAALEDLVPEVGASDFPRWSGCGATPGMSSFPFLDWDVEIQDGDLLDQRHHELERPLRRAVEARGHFPTEQAALALNAFAIAIAITFADRMPAAENRQQ